MLEIELDMSAFDFTTTSLCIILNNFITPFNVIECITEWSLRLTDSNFWIAKVGKGSLRKVTEILKE